MRKSLLSSLLSLLPLLWLGLGTAANGAELAIFVTGSMADPFEALGEDFTHETGARRCAFRARPRAVCWPRSPPASAPTPS